MGRVAQVCVWGVGRGKAAPDPFRPMISTREAFLYINEVLNPEAVLGSLTGSPYILQAFHKHLCLSHQPVTFSNLLDTPAKGL